MKKATTTGANLARRAFLALLLPVCLLAAEKKPDKEKKLVAVIAGTTFRDPGFAIPGVAIELVEIRTDGKKPKSRKTFSDARGEFAFLVPAIEQKYKVKASAKGLQPEEKKPPPSPEHASTSSSR